MRNEEFYREMEGILEAKTGTVRGNDPLIALEGWDSMAVLAFIAMVDEKMGGTVGVERIRQCRTVDDLFETCRRPCGH